MKTRNLLAFGLIALLGAACGGTKSSAAKTSFNCNVAAAGICAALTGVAPADMTQANTLCTSNGGVSVTSCPTANRVGTCTYSGPPAEVDSYYTSNWDATTAQPNCETPVPPDPAGTWKAG